MELQEIDMTKFSEDFKNGFEVGFLLGKNYSQNQEKNLNQEKKTTRGRRKKEEIEIEM